MMKALGLLFLLLSGTLYADSVKVINFEDYKIPANYLIPYTMDEVTKDFGVGDYNIQLGAWGIFDNIPATNIKWDDAGHMYTLGQGNAFLIPQSTLFSVFHPTVASVNNGNSMMVKYQKNLLCKERQGISFRSELPKVTEYYFSYDMFFPANHDFHETAKMPGICGGSCNTGGETPSGDDGWSTRFIWQGVGKAGADGTYQTGTLSLYVYYADQSGEYGTVIPLCFNPKPTNISNSSEYCTNRIIVPKSEWQNFQLGVKLNTSADKADGSVRVWFKDQLVGDVNSIRFYNKGNVIPVNRMVIDSCYGGRSDDFRSPQDNYFVMDNFIGSTRYLSAMERAQYRGNKGMIESLYPNPWVAGTPLNIRLNMRSKTRVAVQLFTVTGQLAGRKDFDVNEGSQVVVWNEKKYYASAMYFIRVVDLNTNKIDSSKLLIMPGK